MEEPCRKTYILFLANVFPDQCQDESEVLRSITEPEILDSSESESEISDEEEIPNFFTNNTDTEEYEALPDYFTGLDSWPKTTNLLCWSCTNKFSNMPWFIPINMVKKVYSENTDDPDEIPENLVDFPDMAKTKEVKAFKRRGCFCNPFCAKRYINRVKDPEIPNKWEANKLLNILYKEITGKDVHNIPEGEDKTIMMQFCGPKGITAQEFRYRNETRNIIL